MKYNRKEKTLKEIDRRKLQKFEIQTKFRIMKTVLGGNLKYRLQLNKINKNSYWHIFSYMTKHNKEIIV